VKRQWVGRLIPALIVSGVLAFSYVTNVPAYFNGGALHVGVSQPEDVGYGNDGNNCGRFGYGTHDHGKLCPHPHPPGQTTGGRPVRFRRPV
jgi:hypothetical protein